ncbi:MAG: hypothetical protein IPI44_14515 [Sulfuritalea sp.]|nr:hypothetical protein [Sulfuritalea sp.]
MSQHIISVDSVEHATLLAALRYHTAEWPVANRPTDAMRFTPLRRMAMSRYHRIPPVSMPCAYITLRRFAVRRVIGLGGFAVTGVTGERGPRNRGA